MSGVVTQEQAVLIDPNPEYHSGHLVTVGTRDNRFSEGQLKPSFAKMPRETFGFSGLALVASLYPQMPKPAPSLQATDIAQELRENKAGAVET